MISLTPRETKLTNCLPMVSKSWNYQTRSTDILSLTDLRKTTITLKCSLTQQAKRSSSTCVKWCQLEQKSRLSLLQIILNHLLHSHLERKKTMRHLIQCKLNKTKSPLKVGCRWKFQTSHSMNLLLQLIMAKKKKKTFLSMLSRKRQISNSINLKHNLQSLLAHKVQGFNGLVR